MNAKMLGSGGFLPQKCLKSGFSEVPFPAFQVINKLFLEVLLYMECYWQLTERTSGRGYLSLHQLVLASSKDEYSVASG